MIDARLALQLDRMRTAAAKALSHVEGLSENEFLLDEKTKDAVVMNFVVLGEAAARIGRGWPDFAADHANWPWHEMRGIRNRSAHAYETVDFHAIWQTLMGSLPEFLRELDMLGPLNRS